MKTSEQKQHRLTEEILSLFQPLPDDICEANDENLRISVDRTVHFYFYLIECFDSDARPDAYEVGDIRIDLVSYVQYFHRLGTATLRDFVLEELHWKWEAPGGFAALRDQFVEQFRIFRSDKTSRMERYTQLMILIKLQLFFLAFTFT